MFWVLISSSITFPHYLSPAGLENIQFIKRGILMNIESLRREIEELKKFNKHSYSSLTAGVYHILLHLGLTKEADELIKDLPVDVQEKIKNHLKN